MGCWANCPGTGLFGKGDDCRDCKDRCNSWFPGDSDLQCGCKELCASGNTAFSRDDYLNSIGLGPEQQQEIEEYNQMVWEMEAQDQERKAKTIQTIISVGFGVILIALILYFTLKYAR